MQKKAAAKWKWAREWSVVVPRNMHACYVNGWQSKVQSAVVVAIVVVVVYALCCYCHWMSAAVSGRCCAHVYTSTACALCMRVFELAMQLPTVPRIFHMEYCFFFSLGMFVWFNIFFFQQFSVSFLSVSRKWPSVKWIEHYRAFFTTKFTLAIHRQLHW